MRRVVLVTAIVVVVALGATLTGCEALLAMFLTSTPATPLEQVEGFLAAASEDPQDLDAMKTFFAPEVADYGSLQLDTYWVARFFNLNDGPYGILGAVDGGEDLAFPGSVTVSGFVTNFVNTDPGYEAVFVLITDPDDTAADPLIRKITVTVDTTTEVIEKVIP